jgi:hypothetical protein
MSLKNKVVDLFLRSIKFIDSNKVDHLGQNLLPALNDIALYHCPPAHAKQNTTKPSYCNRVHKYFHYLLTTSKE